jgi:hypothetical protein
MECTICGAEIQDGATMYELNKGTWAESEKNEGDAEFVHEEVMGNYHEACLPTTLPLEDV